jgi:hypothetical protein
MLYKKTQHKPEELDILTPVAESLSASSSAIHPPPMTGMSVTELRYLLKEKHKQHPEKHAEIQKMKKAELIQALQA